MGDIRIDSNTRVNTVGSEVAGPPPREAVLSAQNLLNAIAGHARYPASGALDAQTRGAIASFQASAGLPETGTPDGATMSALDMALEGIANRGVGLSGLDAADARYGRCAAPA